MKLILLVSFISCSILSCSGLFDPVTRIAKPHVETYWESWDSPENYGANLSTIQVSPIGSTRGVNIVNLAFADPKVLTDWECVASSDCITSGFDMKDSAALHKAVKSIHAAGGFVKMAFGGENYGNPGDGVHSDTLEQLVMRIISLVDEYNLDGVDLTTVRNCGYIECSYVNNQITLIGRLRTLMPNKIISYTFPYAPKSATYSKVISGSIEYLDYVSMSQGTQDYVDDLIEMGIPKHKIVWGQILYRDCSMQKTIAAAEAVAANQYGGVMTWSINSDTYQRSNEQAGACTEFQTGHPDGSYINTVSYILNHN